MADTSTTLECIGSLIVANMIWEWVNCGEALEIRLLFQYRDACSGFCKTTRSQHMDVCSGLCKTTRSQHMDVCVFRLL
jgi:hypothetical protein